MISRFHMGLCIGLLSCLSLQAADDDLGRLKEAFEAPCAEGRPDFENIKVEDVTHSLKAVFISQCASDVSSCTWYLAEDGSFYEQIYSHNSFHAAPEVTWEKIEPSGLSFLPRGDYRDRAIESLRDRMPNDQVFEYLKGRLQSDSRPSGNRE